jgi:ribose transport system substrate-binding protein
LLLLAACGGPDTTTSTPGAPDKPLTSVGISVASLRNPYYAAIARGAEAAVGTENPTAQVTTAGDEYSALKQAAQIDEFIAAHVDMILLTPADPEQIADAIGRARAAGIAVVAIDAPALGADAVVETDNIAAGTLACGALAARLGHGQVAVLGGPASPATTARSFGCADALSRVPDIRVVSADADGSREGARRAMRDLFGSANQIDAVFAINDVQALGAADAAAELGRTTLIAAAEGSPGIETALASRARESIFATAALDPYAMGRNAARVGTDVRNGRTPKSEDRLLDPALVTRETVREYKGWLADRE